MALASGQGLNAQPGHKLPRLLCQAEEGSQALELARSAGGFVLGLVLASLYGALVLLVQGHNIWYCLATTISLGAGLGLSMAFSSRARITVLLSLPQIFTREGKVLMLVLVLGMAVQGPCTNVLHNFSRAAESLSCGAELALNQTAERVQAAQEPLLNALSEIKHIAQKSKAVGDHIRKFFRSIMDSVSHVGRALGNVWTWLLNMTEICNEELGSPHQRCLRLFDDAKENCDRSLFFFAFLCYTIVPFRSLCGLAKLALLFCVIPQYLQSFLKKNVSAPLEEALNKVRREFEFNISAVHYFDVQLNASKSLGEVALDIMENVGELLDPIQEVLGLFTHLSFLAVLYMYLQALRYRRQYLQDDSFDNIYITRQFVALDLRRAQQGRATVLPLTAWENRRYIPPAAPWMTQRERRLYGLQLVGVLRHLLLGVCVVMADYSLFWLLDLVQHHLQGEIVARAPVELGISVSGTGYASDIFRDLVSAFDTLQKGNISVLSQRCLLQPMEPDYSTYLTMGLLYGICLFITVFGGYVARLRRAVCAAYYPWREKERISFLHTNILARREVLANALHQAAMRHVADTGKTNPRLHLLLSRLPAFAWLAWLLGIQQKCLACGVAQQPDFIKCLTPGCKGLYCSECHQTLRNICSVCMGLLTYPDTEDKEMDSSDEETTELWLGAVRTLRGQERGRLLRQRIQQVAKGQGGARRLPSKLAARLQAQLKQEESGESEGGGSGVDSSDGSLHSADFSYQERAESSGSELEEVVAVKLPKSEGRAR
ncbi:DC-STAMP domain-containing protein 2 [Melanerpes formicivorus]|uniref:DC-STAMP domain-containing protein 2 n=1 Tax=Melanerpes formicivorus TaxID=211600 RepID=UPI0035900E01